MAFRIPAGKWVSVEWRRRRHLEATLVSGIDTPGTRQLSQLFVLSNHDDGLVPVDGPRPPHSDLHGRRFEALEAALRELWKVVRHVDREDHQRSMREQH